MQESGVSIAKINILFSKWGQFSISEFDVSRLGGDAVRIMVSDTKGVTLYDVPILSLICGACLGSVEQVANSMHSVRRTMVPICFHNFMMKSTYLQASQFHGNRWRDKLFSEVRQLPTFLRPTFCMFSSFNFILFEKKVGLGFHQFVFGQ